MGGFDLLRRIRGTLFRSHGQKRERVTSTTINEAIEKANLACVRKYEGLTCYLLCNRGQYSDAVLSELENQNDEQLEGMSAKVKMLKDVHSVSFFLFILLPDRSRY